MAERIRVLRVGQLNLQGSAAATTELPVIARALSLDLVLVQEQYRQTRTVQYGSESLAGILVTDPRIAVTFLGHLSNDHCAVAHVSCPDSTSDLYVVSVYCQYSHDIAVHLQHLTTVLDQLAGRPVLVGMDSNAHSPLWHCERRQYVGRGPDTEHRKAQMEGLILGRGLSIHNVEGQPPTFRGPNGQSNVDLTLSNRGLAVSQWTVHEGVSLSDHQLITFEVGMGTARTGGRTGEGDTAAAPVSFRDKGVDWKRFRGVLHDKMGRLQTWKPAQEICLQYSNIVSHVAETCLGRRGKRDTGGYEWWTVDLDKLRHSVYCARRAWQKSRRTGDGAEAEKLETLRAARKSYKSAMREAEVAFFRDVAETGNDDPWGLAYRAASGRVRPPANVMHGIRLTEGHSTTAVGTAAGLLATLCPDDDSSKDTLYHRQVRVAAALAPTGRDSDPPQREALERIVRDLPKTAPGLDGISARIVKHAWRVSGAEMLLMYSACIREGVFPDIWKTGRLVVLPKGNDRPLSDPKAYRPVTLLPILGKILERLIVTCAPCLYQHISEDQHGFSRGKSTVTALNAILDRVAHSSEKYVQVVLLDISGAFDNAWWPMILTKAKQGGCPPNIYRILISYFTERRVGLFMGDQAVWKRSTMGCPQGSVLGPPLWNLLLDDVLRLPWPEGVRAVAYADDITLVIEAPSRAAIERNARLSLEAVSAWGKRNRLSFSATKSQTLTLKGKFKRPPTVRMDGASIASVASAKVLGVVIDEAGSYVPHASLAGQRAVNAFGKMSRISASSWGVRYRALRVLYSGTYVAIVTYAAAVWWRSYNRFAVRSTLLRTQRPALILLTKGYRSVSTAALPVLAGVLPADLEVCRAGRVAQECSGLVGKVRKAAIREVRAEVVALWQERWQSSGDGRELFSFFPDVTARLGFSWVEPDYTVSQVLTGHGSFRSRLHRMSLCDTPVCYCGLEEETRDHVLWDCALYGEARDEMLGNWRRQEPGPVYHQQLVDSPEGFQRLKRFAHTWHSLRKELELRQDLSGTIGPDGSSSSSMDCPNS